MKRTTVWLALAVAAACGDAPAGDAAPGPSDTPAAAPADAAVARAVEAAWAAHIAAAQAKDSTAVMAIYAPDITYAVPPERPLAMDALRAEEHTALAVADVLDAQHRTLDLRVVDDLAYEIGTVTGTVRQGGEPNRVIFDFMALWQRQPDGAWAIRYLLGDS